MSDIISEARRCLKCKKPLCKEACPVNTDIPLIMQLFLDGKMDEAGKILEDAERKNLFIQRKLKNIEAIDTASADKLLFDGVSESFITE